MKKQKVDFIIVKIYMEFFFLKTELRNRIVKRLEKKIKINDWIATILALAGTLTAVVAVNIKSF